MAGGVLPSGKAEQAVLRRYDGSVALPKLDQPRSINGLREGLTMEDGDMLKVTKIPDRISNPIKIDGAAEFTETIGWSPGITVREVFPEI